MTDRRISANISARGKRRRTIISADQLLKLEGLYRQEQWPSREKKEALAKEIGMSTHFVNIWFQNKRSRMKKMVQEEEELSSLKKARLVEEETATKPSKPVQIAPKPQPSSEVKYSNQHATKQSMFEVKYTSTAQPTGIGDGSANTSKESGLLSHKSQINQQLAKMVLKHNQATATSYGTQVFQPVHNAVDRRNLFQWMIAMAAIVEGGIIAPTDSNHRKAVNSALYGIKLRDDEDLLVYDKTDGFQVLMAASDSDSDDSMC
ncbi:uncharacterized protein [Ptychodera flava]|uniref:uncharacterized protein n=1 Tax=Ptychodera flava TaxID=63121 RepID=UPI00396A88EE